MYKGKSASYIFVILLTILFLQLSCASAYNTFKVIQQGDLKEVTLLYSVDSSQIKYLNLTGAVIKIYPSAREDNYTELRNYLAPTEVGVIFPQDTNIGTEIRRQFGISMIVHFARGERRPAGTIETIDAPIIDNGAFSTFKIINSNNLENSQNTILLYGSDSTDFNQSYPMIKFFINDSRNYNELNSYLKSKNVTILIISPQDTNIGTEIRRQTGRSIIVSFGREGRTPVNNTENKINISTNNKSNFEGTVNSTENEINKESNLGSAVNNTGNKVSKPVNEGFVQKIFSWFKHIFE